MGSDSTAEDRAAESDSRNGQQPPRVKVTEIIAVVISALSLLIASGALWNSARSNAKSDAAGRLAERAYLDVDMPSFRLPVGIDGNATFALNVKNTGRSRAKDVYIITAVIFGAYSQEQAFQRQYQIVNEDTPSIAPLPAGAKVERVLQRAPLSDTEIAAFHAGKAAFFVVGNIGYVDVFEARHAREFCYKSERGTVMLCSIHNEEK